MPDSSIHWDNSSPILDFNKTTAYPVDLRQSGTPHTVYVYMTPYKPDELKTVLKKALSGYKREKRDIELIREDRAVYTPLCDDHFVKLGNATGTPVEQRAWLDKRPQLKPSIVEFTFGGLQIDNPEKSEDDTPFDISLDSDGTIKTFQELYDPETDKIVRVNMNHNHAQPTEAQYRTYRGARRSKFVQRSTLWTVTEQHSVLEGLYDAVVQSITGACVDGKPCAAATKADWISFVPLWHKLWVVDNIFGDLVEKNV